MLELNNIAIGYQRRVVVEGLSLSLATGQIGCLLGPSGCGKTSVLRAIAGFEPIREGSIHLHGKQVSVPGRTLAPEKRLVGMVFQDFALFPHLTVEQNIAFGLGHLSKTDRQRRVAELLELVELSGLDQRYSHALSGGQQQRVALARALAPKPDLLLLDEPFSSLDTELRENLATQVRQILKHEGITALLVTHDKAEAFGMADKVGVMQQGQLLQWDEPQRLYHTPNSRLVADFIGKVAYLSVCVVDAHHLDTPFGRLSLPTAISAQPGQWLQLMVRPHELQIDSQGQKAATVLSRWFRGTDFLYLLELGSGEEVLVAAPSTLQLEEGGQVRVSFRANQLSLFESDSACRIA